MKKEVRLIFNLDTPKEKRVYEELMEKAVATAFIKDLLTKHFNHELIDKKTCEILIEKVTSQINNTVIYEEPKNINVTISKDEMILDLNEFED